MLNHRRWKVVYLLCIWVGLELAMSIRADTTYPQPKEPLRKAIRIPNNFSPRPRIPIIYSDRTWLASQRLIDPTARPKNTATLVEDIGKYNTSALSFNTEFNRYKTCWDIEPNKLLPFIQEMRDRLERIQATLTHLDEKEVP
jgi:hypothetical protein